MLMVVIGETQVGKTKRNLDEIYAYVLDNPITGKKGRKVIPFDTNDDDYTMFKTVSLDHLQDFKKVEVRRIRPINRDGSSMSEKQKQEVVKKILKDFRNGLIVLDDIDNWMTDNKGRDLLSTLVSTAHFGLDFITTHQSAGEIRTAEWRNATWIRLHHQSDDIAVYKDRISAYPVVRIAYLIVEEQYNLAYRRYKAGIINHDTFKKQRSFFVYINTRTKIVKGCSKSAFIRAAKKYVDQNCQKQVKELLLLRDLNDQALHPSRLAAIDHLLDQLVRHYEDSSSESPL